MDSNNFPGNNLRPTYGVICMCIVCIVKAIALLNLTYYVLEQRSVYIALLNVLCIRTA